MEFKIIPYGIFNVPTGYINSIIHFGWFDAPKQFDEMNPHFFVDEVV